MDGISKTTLAKKVFNSIVDHFQCLAWFDNKSKYDEVRVLLSNLLDSIVLYTDEIHKHMSHDMGESLTSLKKILVRNNCDLGEKTLLRILKGKKHLVFIGAL